MRKKTYLVVIFFMSAFLVGCTSAKGDKVTSENTQKVSENTETENTEIIEPVLPDGASYAITITINPMVELIIGNDDSVLLVNCLNTDSENAYGNLVEELVGQSAVDASKKIVETAVDKGYLKEGAACTISCESVWIASENIIPQLGAVEESVADLLVEKGRQDAEVKLKEITAIEIIEEAGIKVDEEVKKKQLAQAEEEAKTEVVKELEADSDSWPNILFVVDESTKVKQVVFLNDTANRAYSGCKKNVIGKYDREAAKPYLAAAVDNGYLLEQFAYKGGYDIPKNIFDKLVIFKSEYEAIEEGLIQVPKEFYENPQIALIVDDNQIVVDVVYLSPSAETVYAGVDKSSAIGKHDGDGALQYLSVLVENGRVNNYNIPEFMYAYLFQFCSEEEAIQKGYK